MAELQFVRSFLGSLDSRPQKLPADYIEDSKTYPARPPYILSRMPRAMQKTATRVAPGQEPAAAVSVKSLHRGAPTLDVPVNNGVPLPLATTSVLDVRTALAAQTGIPVAKLKLLHNKKPVADSKSLKELVGGDGMATTLELGVMVVGGAATVVAAAPGETQDKAAAQENTEATPTQKAPETPASGLAVVESEAFWTDLRGFLVGRIRDDKQADEIFSLFARAWEERMI